MLSPDPVLDWLLVEALEARLRKVRDDAEQRREATESALSQAREAVQKAVA